MINRREALLTIIREIRASLSEAMLDTFAEISAADLAKAYSAFMKINVARLKFKAKERAIATRKRGNSGRDTDRPKGTGVTATLESHRPRGQAAMEKQRERGAETRRLKF